MNEITYTKVGDYLLPDIRLSDPPNAPPLGRYGMMHKRYDPNKLPPITKWREELSAKTAKREKLYRDYETLKTETAKVEKIQRSVKEILHSDEPQTERTATRKRDMEL